jgi:DinB superfamily
MNIMWKSAIWKQFGAAIDMLDNAVLACPEELWGDRSQHQEYWYVAYHCLFWLDLYLSGAVEGFAPPAPFTLDELDPAGVLPERVYTKDELHSYLLHCRKKCQATVETLTDEKAQQQCAFGAKRVGFGELLLYNMRHVQEHASQLSLILGQTYGSAPAWVGSAKNDQAGG